MMSQANIFLMLAVMPSAIFLLCFLGSHADESSEFY